MRENGLGSKTLRPGRRRVPGPASSSPHFIPHLVVRGDALPVLKVAAVGAGRSRACPRRHLPCPEPWSPSRRPAAAIRAPTCLPTLRRRRSSAHPTAERFCEDNFRPLCLRRTDSVVTSLRTRTHTHMLFFSAPPCPSLPSLWSAQKIKLWHVFLFAKVGS